MLLSMLVKLLESFRTATFGKGKYGPQIFMIVYDDVGQRQS
jgi:hypothetical protein